MGQLFLLSLGGGIYCKRKIKKLYGKEVITGKNKALIQLFQISGRHFVCDDQRASLFCNVTAATVPWSSEEQSWKLGGGSAFVVFTFSVSFQC